MIYRRERRLYLLNVKQTKNHIKRRPNQPAEFPSNHAGEVQHWQEPHERDSSCACLLKAASEKQSIPFFNPGTKAKIKIVIYDQQTFGMGLRPLRSIENTKRCSQTMLLEDSREKLAPKHTHTHTYFDIPSSAFTSVHKMAVDIQADCGCVALPADAVSLK